MTTERPRTSFNHSNRGGDSLYFREAVKASQLVSANESQIRYSSALPTGSDVDEDTSNEDYFMTEQNII